MTIVRRLSQRLRFESILCPEYSLDLSLLNSVPILSPMTDIICEPSVKYRVPCAKIAKSFKIVTVEQTKCGMLLSTGHNVSDEGSLPLRRLALLSPCRETGMWGYGKVRY